VAAVVVAGLAGLALLALSQLRRADRLAAQSRQRLVRQYVTNGMRLADDGDLFGSLPWLVEALRQEQGHPAREGMHRLRLAAVLARCPRVVQVWPGPAWFSPDGRRVATPGPAGTARVWDSVTGEPITQPLAHGVEVTFAAFSPD